MNCQAIGCGRPTASWWCEWVRSWFCDPCALKINAGALGYPLCKHDDFMAKWGKTCAEIWPNPQPGKVYPCGCKVIEQGGPSNFSIQPCAIHGV